jgi:hypothetical protein
MLSDIALHSKLLDLLVSKVSLMGITSKFEEAT